MQTPTPITNPVGIEVVTLAVFVPPRAVGYAIAKSRSAKVASMKDSGVTRLTATLISAEGATVKDSSRVARLSIGVSLRRFRRVPESALKMIITRLAATASSIL